jgi:hypothetical protein
MDRNSEVAGGANLLHIRAGLKTPRSTAIAGVLFRS